MRKLRILEQISLDGVVQAPGGKNEAGDDYPNGGWSAPYRGPEMGEAVAAAQGERFDLLLGRRTYDVFAGYWPTVGNGPIANGLNAATKYVATHRPDNLGWGPVRTLGTDIVEGVRRIKSSDGPDVIVWGSTTIMSTLLEHGLVDEVVLLVYPIVLGCGKRLFENSSEPHDFTLVGTKIVSQTVLMNTYRHVGSLRT
jgi:dihydrofolate reductase